MNMHQPRVRMMLNIHLSANDVANLFLNEDLNHRHHVTSERMLNDALEWLNLG